MNVSHLAYWVRIFFLAAAQSCRVRQWLLGPGNVRILILDAAGMLQRFHYAHARMQHFALCRLCSQMETPPQSLHALLCRLCSQMEAPPQSLHLLLRRLCSPNFLSNIQMTQRKFR